MNGKYSSKGNLALEPIRRQTQLALVEHVISSIDGAFSSCARNAFGYLHEPSITSNVISVLDGMSGFQFVVGPRERRFAIIASCIASLALFGLSFFA